MQLPNLRNLWPRAISQRIDSARGHYENLSDREKRLVGMMAIVGGVLLFGLPLFLTWNAMREVAEENDEIRSVLSDFTSAGPELAERIAARKAAQNLYATTPPPLGTFLEAKAKEAGYDRPVQMTEEPEKVEGDFRRTHTRASFSAVGLVQFLNMLAEIKNSPYPIAIERVQLEHYQKGDKYNVEVGIFGFEKQSGSRPASAGEDESEGEAK